MKKFPLLLTIAVVLLTSILTAQEYPKDEKHLFALPPKSEIVIDGDLSEWDRSKPAYIGEEEQLMGSGMEGLTEEERELWGSTNDLSALVYINYDEENIYLALEVLDDRVFSEDRFGLKALDGDCIEVFLSSSGSEKYTNRGYTEGDFQIFFMPPTKETESLYFEVINEAGRYGKNPLTMEGVKGETILTGKGYIIEIRFPFAFLNKVGYLNPKDLRLTVGVNDGDSEGDTRMQFMLNSTEYGWQHPRYFMPVTFLGEVKAKEKAAFDFRIILAVLGALIVVALYILGMRYFISFGRLNKLKVLLGIVGITLIVFSAYLIIGASSRKAHQREAKKVQIAGAAVVSNSLNSFLGYTDLREIGERLSSMLKDGSASRKANYTTTPIVINNEVIYSENGIPYYRYEGWSSRNGRGFEITNKNVSAIHWRLNSDSMYPRYKEIVPKCALIITYEDESILEYTLTNGVTLFSSLPRLLKDINPVMSNKDMKIAFRYNETNARFMEKEPIGEYDYEYRIKTDASKQIKSIRYTNYTDGGYFSISSLGISLEINKNGKKEFIPLEYTKERFGHTWQGTRAYFSDGNIQNLLWYPEYLRTNSVEYTVGKKCSSVRIAANVQTDSREGSIPFGYTHGVVALHYADGSVEETKVIDGLNASTGTYDRGLGHPSYFKSKIMYEWVGSFHGFRQEIHIDANRNKTLEKIVLRPYGDKLSLVYGICSVLDKSSPPYLESADSRVFIADGYNFKLTDSLTSILSPLGFAIYYEKGIIPNSTLSAEALRRARSYYLAYPPGKSEGEIDFRDFNIVTEKDGSLIIIPADSEGNFATLPFSLALFLPYKVPLISRVLYVVLLVLSLLSIIMSLLYATHFLVESKKLATKMRIYSIAVTVAPLLIVTIIFLNIYNERMVKETLKEKISFVSDILLNETENLKRSLRENSQAQYQRLRSGKDLVASENIYYMVHRIDLDTLESSLYYSANTPSRFRIDSSKFNLKKSDPVFNSLYGPVFTETTLDVEDGIMLSVTAFVAIDEVYLQNMKKNLQAEVGAHYRSGYEYISTFEEPVSFKIPLAEEREFYAERNNVGMRNINATPYMSAILPIYDKNNGVVFCMSLSLDATDIKRVQALMTVGTILFVLLVAFFTYLVSNWIVGMIVTSIGKIAGGMFQIEEGNYRINIEVPSKDELGYLANGFNSMAKRLNQVRIEDMKMAANVQQGLLISTPPKLNNFDVAFTYQPCSYVSGDLYDLYMSPKGDLEGVVLADVSGHGIAPALITALARPLFYRAFNNNKNSSLKKVMALVNKNLITAKGEADHYLTAVVLRFDNDGVHYANAGHPDLIMRLASGDVWTIKPKDKAVQGTVLGHPGIGESFIDELHAFKFPMSVGDTLLIYTDCLNESTNEEGEEYGIERIEKTMAEVTDEMSAQEVLDLVVKRFREFVGDGALTDDFTLMVLKKQK